MTSNQWRQRLHDYLGLDRRQLGQVGGGRSRLRGVVDVATIQTLARRDAEANAELFAGYGLVVVDECHHVPAVTFDHCLRSASTRPWLGLTATPYRRQGLEETIEMHCGPVRHKITVAGSTSTACSGGTSSPTRPGPRSPSLSPPTSRVCSPP